MEELKKQIHFTSLTRQQKEILSVLEGASVSNRNLTEAKLKAIQKKMSKLMK